MVNNRISDNLNGLPETNDIQSLLSGLNGATSSQQTTLNSPGQVNRLNDLATMSLQKFFGEVNWKNLQQSEPEMALGVAIETFSPIGENVSHLTVGEFLGHVNWRNVPRTHGGQPKAANDPFEKPNEASVESIFGGIQWD